MQRSAAASTPAPNRAFTMQDPTALDSPVKLIYSEKATKFCKIFTLLLSYLMTVKSKVKIRNILWLSQNIWTLTQKKVQIRMHAFISFTSFHFHCLWLIHDWLLLRGHGLSIISHNAGDRAAQTRAPRCYIGGRWIEHCTIQRLINNNLTPMSPVDVRRAVLRIR